MASGQQLKNMITINTVAQTTSTNADMLARAANGAPEGEWLRAETQTAGRGRMGRNWASPPGNLYASTLVRLRQGGPAAPTLGFVAALALFERVSLYATDATDAAIQIKWPNDVMGNGAKLSGILLERIGDAVVIGIGLNLASHPDLPDRKTTSIAALTGTTPDAAIFLDGLADTFQRLLSDWRGSGFDALLARWRAAAHPLGTVLKVSLPSGDALSGIYDGLCDDGALCLRLADGAVRVIHAGDVFLV